MQEFTEQLRYEYPEINQQSVVLDCGGFEGNFAKIIYAKYGCKIFVFEPIFHISSGLLNPDIRVFPIAVGGSRRSEWFKIQNNSTGMFAGQGQPEQEVAVFSFREIIRLFCGKIALVKLNIEGMEFEALECLGDSEIACLQNIQVQFHNVMPGAIERRAQIQERLSRTHELTYCADWCWENWRLK